MDYYETDQTADWLIELQKRRKAEDTEYLTDAEIVDLASKKRKGNEPVQPVD